MEEVISSATAVSSARSKLSKSLKQFKSHFRQFYRRCTCNSDNKISVERSDPLFLSTSEVNHERSRQQQSDGHWAEDSDIPEEVISGCHRIKEHLPCEDFVWFINRETGVGLSVNDFLLPSPPPTGGSVSHPDGDFLFQDKFCSSRPTSSAHNHLRHMGTNNCGDASSQFYYHTDSDLQVDSNKEEPHLKLPTIRTTYCSISELMAAGQGSGRASDCCYQQQQCPKSRGGFSLNDSFAFRHLTSRGKFLPDQPRQEDINRLTVTWKDLPKSISLSINSGYVESMFIPSWSDQPLRKAPFFGTLKKVINWSAINVREERAAVKQQRIRDARRRTAELNGKIWRCRHQIGIMKRKLKMETTNENTTLVDDTSSRFQFVHWLSERDNDVNSAGRYFDVEGKRLVHIKITATNPPPSIYEHLKLKVGALREINALKQLDHVNVIGLLSYFEHQGLINTVLEAGDHSLRCEISCSGTGVDPELTHGVMYQILCGLEHCHQRSLLHRNLCPENVLVTVEGVVKLTDFSKSLFLKGQRNYPSCFPGDIKYGAPELLVRDVNYGLSADIWSVGCILVELIRGELLWAGTTPEEQLLLIHRTVGPLIPLHLDAAGLIRNTAYAGQSLREYFPDNCARVLSLLELCFEVDPGKRVSCRGLLEHPFVRRGSQSSQAEASLPRMALWEARPHTVPVEKTSTDDITTQDSPTREVYSCDVSPRSILKVKTPGSSSSRPKSHVVFAMHQQGTSSSREKFEEASVFRIPKSYNKYGQEEIVIPNRETITSEQLYGIGSKYFWRNLQQISMKPYTVSLQESSPLVRKGNESRKTEGRKPLDNLINNFDVNLVPTTCECSDVQEMINNMPSAPRPRIQYLTNLIPSATWSTVQVFTDHLRASAKKSPKTFSASVGQLTTVLLDQISDSKSKVAGPAIRILNNICEYKGSMFESEADRIIEQMLNKLGGPSFIDKEGNEILRHLIRALKPSKAIITLIKYGSTHKASAARQTAISLVEELIRQLDVITSFGLPGEQTAAQRRFSVAVFEVATKFLKDPNAQTRGAAREIYQNLMHHPGFWYLYQSSVSEEKRHWVNRVLDEIRRTPAAPDYKKNKSPLKSIGY